MIEAPPIEVVCPSCNQKCDPGKIQVHYLTFQDWMTKEKYIFIVEKGKPFSVLGWTTLALISVEDVSMDVSNKHILYKMVKQDG